MASKHGEITESTIARIAGNLLSGYTSRQPMSYVDQTDVARAVNVARAIAAEVRRTTPKEEQ